MPVPELGGPESSCLRVIPKERVAIPVRQSQKVVASIQFSPQTPFLRLFCVCAHVYKSQHAQIVVSDFGPFYAPHSDHSLDSDRDRH